jgi:TonB family protein
MGLRAAVFALVLAPVLTLSPCRSFSQEAAGNTRRVLTRVAPEYPRLARTMNIQGVVKAVVWVAPNGSVKAVEVKGGHPVLVQSAQNALLMWKFEAGPHETHETIEIRFSP